MIIFLNGMKKETAQGISLRNFLGQEGYADKKIAAAVNGNFVPKTEHATIMLNDSDSIEVVAPMQGG